MEFYCYKISREREKNKYELLKGKTDCIIFSNKKLDHINNESIKGMGVCPIKEGNLYIFLTRDLFYESNINNLINNTSEIDWIIKEKNN